MDLAPYVDSLSRELAVAAEAGGADARALAERLVAPLESAARLTLLEALSAAAAEITRELAPGSVDVRLRGRDPSFVVTQRPTGRPTENATEGGTERSSSGMPASPSDAQLSSPPDADEGATTRINFRLPEQLKRRIEEAAGRERLSVNTWLVRAAAGALEPDDRDRGSTRESRWGGQHYTGWVR